MKWLVDAQLPLALAVAIRMTGRDVKHTLDLTLRNSTSDELIHKKLLEEGRILITKDRDFRTSHILRSEPKQLVFVITGNIRNQQLIPLFIRNLPVIEAAFERGSLVTFGLNGVDVQA
jgi:predicted nuclease of predicted toxin-antitoxin system